MDGRLDEDSVDLEARDATRDDDATIDADAPGGWRGVWSRLRAALAAAGPGQGPPGGRERRRAALATLLLVTVLVAPIGALDARVGFTLIPGAGALGVSLWRAARISGRSTGSASRQGEPMMALLGLGALFPLWVGLPAVIAMLALKLAGREAWIDGPPGHWSAAMGLLVGAMSGLIASRLLWALTERWWVVASVVALSVGCGAGVSVHAGAAIVLWHVGTAAVLMRWAVWCPVRAAPGERLCRKCGHDLTGIPARKCPGCGVRLAESEWAG